MAVTEYLYPDARIAVFARAPRLGAVKTRLEPALGATGCLQLYQALLVKTVSTVQQAGLAPMQLWVTDTVDHEAFSALNGEHILLQQGKDLGARMLHTAQSVLSERGVGRVIIIGTDCPGMDQAYLQSALTALQGQFDNAAQVVIGPAEDGGYVLLGMTRPVPEILLDMEWGNEQVLSRTRSRLCEHEIPYRLLESRWDVDVAEDLERLQSAYPSLTAGLSW